MYKEQYVLKDRETRLMNPLLQSLIDSCPYCDLTVDIASSDVVIYIQDQYGEEIAIQ
jgi:hypothetical protein